MSEHIIETRQVPVKEAFDLIVAGGGVAGIAAALAGARRGVKTMLVEKGVFLGGLATLGLINWYEPLCDGAGRTMTTGIAEELLKLSVAYGYGDIPEQWLRQGEPKPEPHKRYASRFNPAVFALALNELLVKNGVELRYDMIASWPVMEGSRCTGLITESAGGREYIPATVIIDATGDADIMARAGVPCRNGVNYLTYTAHGCTAESAK
ncbi:MAG: FAD-dependent oxidoreductase, partial [Treponema sp.]|nr:FAD-dependent oxidoreductase [Treponema sp.]